MAISRYVKGRCYDRLWQRTRWSESAISGMLLGEFEPSQFMDGGAKRLIDITDAAMHKMTEVGRATWAVSDEREQAKREGREQ